MGNVQDYIKNYNKEHYKTINTKVSPELYAKLNNFKKENNLSIPKILELGLNAIISYEVVSADYERAKKALKNLSDNGWEVIGEKEKKITDLTKERDSLIKERDNLKKQIDELKNRSFFDFLLRGVVSRAKG